MDILSLMLICWVVWECVDRYLTHKEVETSLNRTHKLELAKLAAKTKE